MRACGCDSICAYVLPYHSIFLHTHFGKSGKCRLEPTQTATTSSILCRRHGPIWPKLERHVVSSLTCRDMSATFPPKPLNISPPRGPILFLVAPLRPHAPSPTVHPKAPDACVAGARFAGGCADLSKSRQNGGKQRQQKLGRWDSPVCSWENNNQPAMGADDEK